MDIISKPLLRFTATPNKVNYNGDGSIDIIFRLLGYSNEIPSDEALNESIYLLKVSQRMAKKITKEITTKTILKITGILQASVNSKKIPFILVRPISLSIDSQSMQIIEAKKNRRMKKGWYKDKDLIEINVDDIIMTNLDHLNCKSLNMNGAFLEATEKKEYDSPVAVNQLSNGKYELISGIRSFIVCKVIGIKTIQAHITELSHKEFLKENGFEIYDFKKKAFYNKKSVDKFIKK